MKKNKNNTIYCIIELIVIITAGVMAIFIKSFLFDIVKISGRSMEPYLNNNDCIIVRKLIDVKSLKRQQVVIFDYKKYSENFFIKRIIGLPSDRVEIKSGNVYVNGNVLKENYLKNNETAENYVSLVVPKDCVFVLGDNRNISEDSRMFGPVPVKNIKGIAEFKIFPFKKIFMLK